MNNATLREISKVLRPNCNFNNAKLLSTQASTKSDLENFTRTDEEWLNAKPFEEMPGPSKYLFPLSFLPGGRLYNSTLIDIHKYIRDNFGNISFMHGSFGQHDTIFTYNPEDFKKVYRTEGVWPIRIGLNTFSHYRLKVRPEIFRGIGGLVTEQGQDWYDIRTKVNPILLKPQTIQHHLSQIDEIATELLKKIPELRDPETLEVPGDFGDEIRRWSFESISSIALNRRLGLVTSRNPDNNVTQLSNAMRVFFQLSFEFDVLPSFWKYYESPKFKRLMSAFDDITDATINYINDAVRDFESRDGDEAHSVIEKLLKLDKRVAIVMAMDMLMAGIDTTSSACITILYHLAKNPSKQEKLREELIKIFPEKDTPSTNTNTKNMPYLRACIKEALRLTPITPANFRLTGQDLVLSGYRVPKGIGVLMGVMALSNEETYFFRSKDFIPERWLKGKENVCQHAKGTNPFAYLPFGFGPRTCIGKRIAEMEMETLISKLVRNYKVSWNYPDMKYISNIILVPDGEMKFKFEDI